MILQTDVEASNTREKLRLLEESYEELARETGGDEELRDASMQSLKRLINQFKEEIARFEAGCRSDSRRGAGRSRGITNDQELSNTCRKLQRLDELYREAKNDTKDLELQEIEMESLQRTINQFKEEIARYQARRPIRRP